MEIMLAALSVLYEPTKPLYCFMVLYNISFRCIQMSGRVPTVMEILEKSWKFKMSFSRPGKVMEFCKFSESFGKVMEF